MKRHVGGAHPQRHFDVDFVIATPSSRMRTSLGQAAEVEKDPFRDGARK
jgi:hypothetical protein